MSLKIVKSILYYKCKELVLPVLIILNKNRLSYYKLKNNILWVKYIT